MKKLIPVILFNLIIIGEAFSFGHNGFIELQDEKLTQEQLKNKKLDVDIRMRNFHRKSDRQKIAKATEILKKVMNSNEFKQRILNFKWKDKIQFNENQEMSNADIYQHLMTGKEVLMPQKDYIMNIDITLYRSRNPWSKVKGYTKKSTMRIWINKKFFRKKSWTAVDTAGNLAHEWVHKMGFGHAYKHNPDRPFTVPYAVGRIVGEVARQFGYK